MSSARLRYSLLAVLLMVTVPLAATALAASTTASNSTAANAATLTLSVKAKRALARQHVTLHALKPATRRQSSYALPEHRVSGTTSTPPGRFTSRASSRSRSASAK